MGRYVETYRGVVYPWLCDQLGHLNVQHYVGMFDQGAFHLLAAAGVEMGVMHQTGLSFADVQHLIQFKSEQRMGSLIRIEGCIRRIGTKSVTLFQRMYNAESGELAATTEISTVYFDLKTRQSLPIPDALRESMTQLLVPEDPS
jgi:acyl-CoA thioester hydrolase